MGELVLNMADIADGSVAALETALSADGREIAIEVPTCIGSAGCHIPIAEDLLQALFVGESIAGSCASISDSLHYHPRTYAASVRFGLQPSDVGELARQLTWLSVMYRDDVEENGDESVLREVQNALQEFYGSLEERDLRFPDLADHYMANYVGGYYDYHDWGIQEDYSRHPERRYLFFKSFASKQVGYDFYVSHTAWIVPRSVDLIALLKRYGYANAAPALREAHRLSVPGLPDMVANSGCLVHYPQGDILHAQVCAQSIWETPWDSVVLGPVPDISSLLLSDEGDVLVGTDAHARYVLFPKPLSGPPGESVERCVAALAATSEQIGDMIGLSANISCDWHDLDDEQFEQLCYDVLASCDRYDPATIRKMGKSRSRDGGRDIVAQSRERLGKPVIKWIVQCKLISDGRSLSGTRVNVSDTVDQYGANGFCVMTSGHIDSTLYDRLDGIARNRHIAIDDWDRLKLERFLAHHPHIRQRYF